MNNGYDRAINGDNDQNKCQAAWNKVFGSNIVLVGCQNNGYDRANNGDYDQNKCQAAWNRELSRCDAVLAGTVSASPLTYHDPVVALRSQVLLGIGSI